MAEIMNHCLGHKIVLTLESPGNSIMGKVPEFKKLESKTIDLWFQTCMHGGKRDKSTRLRTNMPEIKGLR
eukprot:323974-Karenia_brevis.AAC.1